jgi:hypothetical protein
MGKKRRVLNNPKFAKLRTHPKYAEMVATRGQEEESCDVVTKQREPEIVKEPVVAPFLVKLRTHPKYAGMVAAHEQGKEESCEVVIKQPEPEIAEITPELKVVKLEKPKPAPKTKAKSKTKKITVRKSTRKKK